VSTQASRPLCWDYEHFDLTAALQPPKRKRPLIAVIGINDATEITDYLMPAGILRRANVADVELLATAPGPLHLFPALTVLPDATIGDFDTRHPEGADYVIVPAMSRDNVPMALTWIREQAATKGAIVIGVCAGAKVLGAAGLLDGRKATTHWYYVKQLRRRHPLIRYVPDRRIVVDGRIVTTTGITASIPLTLILVEAIAGGPRALATAADIGVERWDACHESNNFTLTLRFAVTVLRNRLSFWRHEQMELALKQGLDEVSLALVADAWSRTYRARVLTIGTGESVSITSNGVRLVPDMQSVGRSPRHSVLTLASSKPVTALNTALEDIGRRYGAATASVVAMQLEYPVGANSVVPQDTTQARDR